MDLTYPNITVPYIRARFSDGLVILFPGGRDLFDDHQMREYVARKRRHEYDLSPLALWCNWGWEEPDPLTPTLPEMRSYRKAQETTEEREMH